MNDFGFMPRVLANFALSTLTERRKMAAVLLMGAVASSLLTANLTAAQGTPAAGKLQGILSNHNDVASAFAETTSSTSTATADFAQRPGDGNAYGQMPVDYKPALG